MSGAHMGEEMKTGFRIVANLIAFAALTLAGWRASDLPNRLDVARFMTQTEDATLDVPAVVGRTRGETDRLFAAAISNLERLRSLSANLEFESNFFGERRVGRGRYAELSERSQNAIGLPPLETNRFLLHAVLAPNERDADRGLEENTLDVVCDADRKTWWRFSSIEGSKSLVQLNIEELENSLAQLDEDETNNLIESGVDRACGMSGMPGLGGLSGALKRLASLYRFELEPSLVRSEKGDEFYKATGVARERFREAVRRNFGDGTPNADVLANVPEKVEIYFGKDWAFPFKISYYGVGATETTEPLFSVSYSSVVREDASIAPEHFNYAQPQINSERYESDYLQELVADPED